MRKLNISAHDAMNLKRIINANNKKSVIAQVILMRNEGKDISAIISQTQLSKRTVINYIKMYCDKGIKFIYSYKKTNKSALETIKDKIYAEFYERHPLSYKEATKRISDLFGSEYSRSETQIRKFLNKHLIYTDKSYNKLSVKQKKSYLAKKKAFESDKEDFSVVIYRY